MALGWERWVIRGDTQFDDLVTFTAYLPMLVNPMRQIGSVIDVSQRASAALNRITRLLQERPGVRNVPGAATELPADVPIRIQNLTFRYPYASEPVLKDINLTIEPGTTVALVGRSGSGKTTLAHLLLRVFEPPRHNLPRRLGRSRRRPGHLRRHIAYVPQDVFLFSTTVAENVAFGVDGVVARSPPHTEAQVCQGIAEAARRLRYNAGREGRRHLRRPKAASGPGPCPHQDSPILILDDSLSAVDTRPRRRSWKH